MEERLVLAKELVAKWLELCNTYRYSIDNVEDLGIKVSYSESTPMGEWDSNYFIIKNGRIFNSNGDDVIDLDLFAYDYDLDRRAEVEAFAKEYLNRKE